MGTMQEFSSFSSSKKCEVKVLLANLLILLFSMISYNFTALMTPKFYLICPLFFRFAIPLPSILDSHSSFNLSRV